MSSVSAVAQPRLRGQWIVGKRPPEVDGWRSIVRSGEFALWAHPSCRCEVVERDQETIACLGTPSWRGTLPDNPIALLADAWAQGTGEADPLRWIAGTYAIVRAVDGDVWIYTDPAAMMGVYFAEGVAASSPALLGPLMRDASIDRMYRFGGTDDWYPGSLTPFRGVRSLLANHRYDGTVLADVTAGAY